MLIKERNTIVVGMVNSVFRLLIIELVCFLMLLSEVVCSVEVLVNVNQGDNLIHNLQENSNSELCGKLLLFSILMC